MEQHTIQLDIVSAEAEIFSGRALQVIVPGHDGELGILPQHIPLLTALKPGQVCIKIAEDEEETLIYVSGGMCEVQPWHVTILSDLALRAEDLDEAAAMDAKANSERLLTDAKSDFDHAQAAVRLAQALAQLKTIQQLRKRAK